MTGELEGMVSVEWVVNALVGEAPTRFACSKSDANCSQFSTISRVASRLGMKKEFKVAYQKKDEANERLIAERERY